MTDGSPADPLDEYRRKRDFGRTSEPAGTVRRRNADARLEFVIQKHDASTLHYDLRLELRGVMKSWAVPRGMTLDPATRRLAMQTEDHPIDYNAFEGTIPSNEYGGGTVLIWDRGEYFADEAGPDDDEEAVLEREYEAGKLSVSFLGERMRGSWALVRTERERSPKWLLIKHRDEHVRRDVDPGDVFTTSVVTGRTLDEIAEEDATDGFEDAGISAMLFRYVSVLPSDREWVFEPTIRGARVHVYVTSGSRQIVPALHGTAQLHRDVGKGLVEAAGAEGRSFVLDGEIAGDERTRVFHAYDLLFEDGAVLLDRPWRERRHRLEQLFEGLDVPDVELVPVWRCTAVEAIERAVGEGRAGVVAKRRDSRYRPGERTDDWLKLIFRGNPLA